MQTQRRFVRVIAIAACCVVALGTMTKTFGESRRSSPIPAPVVLQKLPEGCIQPQAAVDSRGIVHLVYFKGKPEAGDLYYVHYPAVDGLAAASTPIRVNSQPETATAMGTIRSEQIALGERGRVHVVWNGLGPRQGKPYAPMYLAYARVTDAGTGFEPQRNLCTVTGNLDGGGSVAADGSGSVYAFWHAHVPDGPTGEAGRGVFLAVSRDDGKTFGKERLANPDPTGACGCCSMRAFVDKRGILNVLYRAAMQEGTQRDTVFMSSADRGASFKLCSLDRWPLNACPMSSFSLADDGINVLGAWETRYQVFWSPLDSAGKPLSVPIVAPGAEKSKHPVVLSNGKGQSLFAWTEETAWAKGGSLSWQLYDAEGKPAGPRGHLADGVPTWSLLTGYARPDGSFVIVH